MFFYVLNDQATEKSHSYKRRSSHRHDLSPTNYCRTQLIPVAIGTAASQDEEEKDFQSSKQKNHAVISIKVLNKTKENYLN
jgi:hypothetical protein